MPTYDVVSGDTVWGLSRRALEEYLGRRPTNREILEIVNQVSVPSGDVNLIFPGEQITIPVGPAYTGGGDIQEDPDSYGPPPGRPGGGDIQADDPAGRAGLPGGSPGGSVNAPAGGRPDGWVNPARPRTGDPIRDAALDAFAETGEWPNPLAGTGWEAYHRGPPLGLNTQEDMERLAKATAIAAGGALFGRGIGALFGRTRGAGAVAPTGQPALPSGARPALPAGPPGGYPAAGGGRMPFQFGPGPAASPAPGAAARSRWPSENELRAARNVIPNAGGPRPPAGGGWANRWWGSGGYSY